MACTKTARLATIFLFLVLLGWVAGGVLESARGERRSPHVDHARKPAKNGTLGNIIDAPLRPCPPGQRRDWRGNCRLSFGALSIMNE
ncbi:uncharacterized protein LOC124362065 [Homalodisca vitripennis]|uniref:uncharacterized protein LOC124362065 n=1 Tax=Homalodisca vitripennis TaxID=197043 RepID=UPI001EEB29EB|nr:uncharacterized protein LOC124362065 [Homalodisca vitripennis]